MATRVQNARVLLMISMISLSLIGMIMVYTISNENKFGRLAGIWLSAIFACDIPMALSLITSNVGGFTKKATVSAMMVSKISKMSLQISIGQDDISRRHEDTSRVVAPGLASLPLNTEKRNS